MIAARITFESACNDCGHRRTHPTGTAARITFESACNDCGHRRTHPTGTAARRAAWAHETIYGHFAIMADWNGWTRP